MWLFLLASITAASAVAEGGAPPAPISIVFPPEGYTLPPLGGLRVLGLVSHHKAPFRVNGQPIKPYRTGAFLAYLPVVPGSNTFHCELDLPGGTTSLDRTFFVASPAPPLPASPPTIDLLALQPSEDLELRPGDWFTVTLRGSPGMTAEFQLGRGKPFPMVKINPSLYLYQGSYQVQPGDAFDSAEVRFVLKDDQGNSTAAAAKGRLSLRPGPPPVAMIEADGPVNIRTGPGSGFMMFPLPGTRVLVGGRQGAETKVLLSSHLSGWIKSSALQALPAGTAPPSAILHTIRTVPGQDSTSVHLGLTDTVPFLIEPEERPDAVRVRLFYTTGDTDWMVYSSSDPYVRELRWRQEESGTAVVTVLLHPDRILWGYHASWDGGALKLEFKHPPKLAKAGSVLKGRVIVLDPGHMPSQPGAVGPRGILEKDVNLGIAKALQGLLEKAGARPVMTRTGEEEVGLSERTQLAWKSRGELFLSIHNNNLPDGANPFAQPHGFSVFYYHPHSLELARTIHRSYLRRIPLPDEQLRYGNLLVARLTQMPSVLVESAYMTYPEQEALLASPVFQGRLARAMLEGVREFLEGERARQARETPIPIILSPPPMQEIDGPTPAAAGASPRAMLRPRASSPASARKPPPKPRSLGRAPGKTVQKNAKRRKGS